MRIGIDARFFGPGAGTGLGRYTERLLHELDQIETDHTFVVLLREENFLLFQPAHEERFEKVHAPWRWYSLAEQIHLPRLLRRLHLGLMHFPHFNVPLAVRVPFIVTVHDLILNKFPTERASTLEPIVYWAKHTAYTFVIRTAIRRSRHIITVSANTQRDIIETYATPAAKITVTYEACDPPGEREIAGVDLRQTFGITKPFIMYVGTSYPHKNLERLIGATLQLRQLSQDVQLVMVGRNDFFSKRLQAYVKRVVPAEHRDLIIFTGYVEDRVLNALYSSAVLYAFPSLYEGFGLPGLEAMARGLPVVAARASSLPEVYRDAAAYFDPLDVNQIATTIEELLNDLARRDELRRRGYECVRRFSWKEMAQQTLDVYNRFVS